MRILTATFIIAVAAMPLASVGQTSGALRGRIVDATTGAGVVGARVTLLPGERAALPEDRPQRAALVAARVWVTGSTGSYRFGEVPPGHYRLLVRRIGYRPTAVDLQLNGLVGMELSVGLLVAPIRLEPLVALELPNDLYTDREARPSDRLDPRAREVWRQNAFVATDVRTVGQSDVDNAITLGERDIFRALRRFPGVSGRDDWSAEPWVRGAPAGHTRTYFDGIPLFNPLHSGGLASSIDPDALSAVLLYPSVRPPGLAEGAAAVLDLRSRAAAGTGDVDGRLSVTGSRMSASLARRWFDGRFGTTLTAARSWRQPTRRLAKTVNGLTAEIPNEFVDLVIRSDVVLGPQTSLEVSGLWQRDWIDRGLAGGPANNRAGWGSALGRATLKVPLGSGIFRQTAGFSRYDVSVRQIEPRTPLAAFDSLPTQEPTDNDLLYVTLMGEWMQHDPRRSGAGWRLGYELGHYRTSYRGAPPTPHSVLTYLYTLELTERVSFARLWAQRGWQLGDDWFLQAGVRSEHFAPAAATFVEPYGSLRHDITDRLRVSLASARFVQYSQPLAPAGLRFGPELNMGPVWVLAPTLGRALVSDITTLGAEYWLSDDWLGSVHLYGRETDGIAMPDPQPGPTDDDELLVGGHNDAWGTEVSLRKLTGRWTGSAAYSLTYATYSAAGLEFPAPADRRHTIDLTASSTLSPRLMGGAVHVGAAVSVASGAPYTRIHPGWYDCSDYVVGGHCDPVVSTLVEAPNAQRAPWTTGVNVRLEWNRVLRGWRMGVHAQVQNALNASRGMTYAVDRSRCQRRTPGDPLCGADHDAFVPGISRHLEVGLRVVF